MRSSSSAALFTSLLDALGFTALNPTLLERPGAFCVLISCRFVVVFSVTGICFASGWKRWAHKPGYTKYLYSSIVAYALLVGLALLVFLHFDYSLTRLHFTWEGARVSWLPFVPGVGWLFYKEYANGQEAKANAKQPPSPG